MPHLPAMPPADRVFARLAKFEVACPSCGAVIVTHRESSRSLPVRLHTISRVRGVAAREPRNPSLWKLVWNPHTQRLRCPHCGHAYVAGLVLFSVQRGARRILDAPIDTVPTAHERAELTRLTGGWHSEAFHARQQAVNLVIDTPCSCPVRGWLASCAVHGDPAAGAVGGRGGVP